MDPKALDICEDPWKYKSGADVGRKALIAQTCMASSPAWVLPSSAAFYKNNKFWCTDKCVFTWSFQFIKKLKGTVHLLFKTKNVNDTFGVVI